MRKGKKRLGLLVAVEIGAAWPAPSLTERGAVCRVIAQNEGETPEAFASRLGGLAAQLFTPDVELRDAVVTCNERTDPAATVARRAMGAMLVECLGDKGKLAFTAGAHVGGRLRHALSALALEVAPAGGASVTVHFEEPASSARRSDRPALRVA
jgi:hypothetical protein